MHYNEISDPYATGDNWYKQYELQNDENDGEQVIDFLIEQGYDYIPKVITEFPVDGDEGIIEYEIYPLDILSEDDINSFKEYLSGEGIEFEE